MQLVFDKRIRFLEISDFVQSILGSWNEGEVSEAATVGVLWKKMFLKISQNSQENTCATLRTPFLQNTFGRLLLKYPDDEIHLNQNILFC